MAIVDVLGKSKAAFEQIKTRAKNKLLPLALFVIGVTTACLPRPGESLSPVNQGINSLILFSSIGISYSFVRWALNKNNGKKK